MEKRFNFEEWKAKKDKEAIEKVERRVIAEEPTKIPKKSNKPNSFFGMAKRVGAKIANNAQATTPTMRRKRESEENPQGEKTVVSMSAKSTGQADQYSKAALGAVRYTDNMMGDREYFDSENELVAHYYPVSQILKYYKEDRKKIEKKKRKKTQKQKVVYIIER